MQLEMTKLFENYKLQILAELCSSSLFLTTIAQEIVYRNIIYLGSCLTSQSSLLLGIWNCPFLTLVIFSMYGTMQ